MGRFIPNENSFIGFTVGPIGAMSAPGSPTATAAAGSGSLAAGPYSYKITAVNDEGETVASAAASVTTVSLGGVTVGWASVAGATGYNIYGRSGTVHLLTAVGDVTTYLDTGALDVTTIVPPAVGSAGDIAAPHVADINECVDLTKFATSLNASSQGNNVPTPDLKRLFETSILGTSQATFTGDFYRDDTVDSAWELLPRKTEGFFVVARFGGIPNQVGDHCEIWPVRVTSRSMANMTNNTVETFTLTCAVPSEPNEDAVVVA